MRTLPCALLVASCAYGPRAFETDLAELVCTHAQTCRPEAWAAIYGNAGIGRCVGDHRDNRLADARAAQCTLQRDAVDACLDDVDAALQTCSSAAEAVALQCEAGLYTCTTACDAADDLATACGNDAFDASGSASQGDVYCLDGTIEACLADCIVELGCAAFDGERFADDLADIDVCRDACLP